MDKKNTNLILCKQQLVDLIKLVAALSGQLTQMTTFWHLFDSHFKHRSHYTPITTCCNHLLQKPAFSTEHFSAIVGPSSNLHRA